MRTIETKGQFAKRKNRRPSAVSNWISDGRITRAALVGTGNRARIWVEQAEADLIASLDPSQQLAAERPANQRTTLPMSLMPDDPEKIAAPPASAALAGPMSDRERDLARRAKADADRAEFEAESARRRLMLDNGKYVVAEDAARAWGRELSTLIAEIETFLASTMSRALAEKHGLDWKALSVEIREKFRGFRGSVSEAARNRREALDEAEAAAMDGQS